MFVKNPSNSLKINEILRGVLSILGMFGFRKISNFPKTGL